MIDAFTSDAVPVHLITRVRAGATKVAPWTDDYSDIIGAILRKKM
jgi:hypothetical protein